LSDWNGTPVVKTERTTGDPRNKERDASATAEASLEISSIETAA
jgi:hypothetical protein